MRKLGLIDGNQLVSIFQVVIPSYFAAQTVSSHQAFNQAPDVK
jgi:hypothetical protein